MENYYVIFNFFTSQPNLFAVAYKTLLIRFNMSHFKRLVHIRKQPVPWKMYVSFPLPFLVLSILGEDKAWWYGLKHLLLLLF